MIRKYIRRLLIALDQSANVLLGGEPDETISSRAGRNQDVKKWAKILCKGLNWIDSGHCAESIEFTPEGSPDPHHLQAGKEKL